MEENSMDKISPQMFWDGSRQRSDEDVYACPVCRDTGWLIGEDGAYPCDCRKKQMLSCRKRACGLQPALISHCFDEFHLDFYPEYMIDNDGRSFRLMAEKALVDARCFADDISCGRPHRGLFLQGEVGRGKTYIASAVANYLLEHDISVRFIVVPEFLDKLRYSYDNANSVSEESLMYAVLNVPVLILDDLGSHNYSEWTKNKIYSLLNYRLNNNLPNVITSNLGIEQLKEILGLRTVSRIVECCDFYLLCSDKDNRLKVRNK